MRMGMRSRMKIQPRENFIQMKREIVIWLFDKLQWMIIIVERAACVCVLAVVVALENVIYIVLYLA